MSRSTVFGGNSIVSNGLILWLDAANRRSYPGYGTSWRDLTTNENNGILINGPSFDSSNGGSIQFDGVNDYVNLGSLNLQQNWTIETFCYMNSDTNFGIFGQGTLSNNAGLHMLYRSSTRGMIFGMYANDNDYQNNYRPTINRWYHWVYTYNNSTYQKQFYADSILQTPAISVQNQYIGSGTFIIGACYSSAIDNGNGRFALVRLYNKVLSAQEILQNYNATKTRFGL